MTNEEAYKYIKERYESHLFNAEENYAIMVAIEALEKQIPKKVTNQEGYYFPPCPSCGRKSAFVGKNNYCEVCGQRLVWGNEDGKVH